MADFQLTMTLNGGEADKTAVVAVSTIAPPIASQIQLIIKDTVDVSRRVEILEGWRFLWNGVRDNGILNGDKGFLGNDVYVSCPIDDLRGPGRKFSTDPAIMLDGDIALSLDASVSVGGAGAVNSLESAFKRLRESAGEFGTWVA